MKAAIVNADDFGLSPGVNQGILDGFRNGILTSTSLLANLPAFDNAVTMVKANPDLSVGMHLSLLWGSPVSGARRVPSLVNGQGRFLRSAGRLAARAALRRLSIDQIELEFRNQIRKALDAGLTLTHLNTHKHIHALPIIRKALLTVAAEFGIDRVRLPREARLGLGDGPRRRGFWKSAAKRDLIRLLCHNSAVQLRAAGLRTTDHFVGIMHSAQLDREVLSYILRNLADGVTEIMCHPGFMDDELREYAGTPPHRELELEALKDPGIRDDVTGAGVRLIHFGELW